ncbi:nucleotidyltransferase domain-containing protein [Nigerium massiliense]|uniref:nucleotidyltransferase domain-containing protein n=1 Tax=Nigerium massiliense TaxID=1522317 RepID=UPI00058DFCD5|nr:nucleotidyltransferase domain-containing protein [Nigerium massiliense]
MRDPLERLDSAGFIETGVDARQVQACFQPILDAIGDSVDDDVAVYVYGSVATGRARVGHSDVDVVALGMDPTHARLLGRELSSEYAAVTREVAIGAWSPDDLTDGDAGYGNRIFLKHYCAWLSGPDPAASLPRFRGDARAARGFNGDFAAVVTRWSAAVGSLSDDRPDEIAALARRIGRKSLFAVAGMVSVHDAIWTTDRATGAARWAELHPELADDLALLLAWGDGVVRADHHAVARLMRSTVPELISQFASHIGAWGEAS